MQSESAGGREAAGAILGMQETYGRPLPAVGDWVTGVAGGKRFSGEVIHADPTRVIVEVECEVFATVRPSEIEG